MRDEKKAIAYLQSHGIAVEERAYGFCLLLDGDFAECGMDNDSSISISIDLGQPPVHWFFRVSFLEMAEFIVKAFEKLCKKPTREQAYQAMKILDQNYDASALDAKTEIF